MRNLKASTIHKGNQQFMRTMEQSVEDINIKRGE